MQDFRQTKRYFDQQLKSNLQKLEKNHESLKKLNIIYIIGILIFIVSIFMEKILLSFISLAPVVILMLINREKYNKANNEYKQMLVAPLMKSIDSRLQYKPNGKINEKEFQNSSLFKHSQHYESEHLISCPLSNKTVTMAYINAYTSTQGIDEDDVDSEQIIFSGLFTTIKSSRKIKGKVCVFPDFAQKHLGFVGEGVQNSKYKRLNKVRLDDPRFEKEFLVYASDQITANYILTHTVMEALTSVAQKERKNLSISFVDDKIYIAISMSNGFFQHNITEKYSDFSTISESLKSFYLVMNILQVIEKHHEL